MKLLILSDLHIGKRQEMIRRPGEWRQANETTAVKLESLINKFNSTNYDLVINLGDIFAQNYGPDGKPILNDSETYKDYLTTGLKLIKQLKSPLINILGNQELRSFEVPTLSEIFESNDLDANFQGFKDFNNLRIIWLNYDPDKNNQAECGEERLNWLKNVLNTERKVLVFSHYPFIRHDTSTSFYFEGHEYASAYQDYEKILNVLDQHKNIIACIAGHVHILGSVFRKNISYIFAPSFSENIAAEDFVDNNPAIYSELEVNDEKLIFKSFSGKYCFNNIEIYL